VCFLSPVEQLDGVLLKEWIARVIELAQAEARQKRPRHGVVEGFLRHLPCFDRAGDVVEHVISCGNGNENENGGSFCLSGVHENVAQPTCDAANDEMSRHAQDHSKDN
jgi:hypothetical protein